MDPSSPTETISVVLRSQAQTIENQQQTIQQQQLTIDGLSGGRRKTLALEKTIAEMWEAHYASIPDASWKKGVFGIMKAFLAQFSHKKVGEFGPSDWEAFRDSPATRERIGVASLNNILSRLKIVFARAIDAGTLHEDPLRTVKLLRKPPKRTTQISEKDEKAVLDDLDPISATMFVVAIDSAMRREEVRLLQWSEVNLETRRVFLSAQRTKTKTARTAYLTARAAAMLAKLPRYPGCTWVFANPESRRPYGKTRLWKQFRRAVADNGVQCAPGDGAMRWHDATRRTAACRLIRNGAMLPAVQRIMGHSQLSTTLMYLSADDDDVARAHALLERSTRKGPMRAPKRAGPEKSAGQRRRATG